MNSLLNFISGSAGNINAFLNIIENDNFVNFANDMNENGIVEYNERLVVKFLYSVFDPIVIPFIQNKKTQSIFVDQKQTKECQIKTFIVKLVAHIYAKYEETGVFTVIHSDNKTLLMHDTSEYLCQLVNINKIQNGEDIYKILLEHFGLQISENLSIFIKSLSIDSIQSKDVTYFVNNVTKLLNDTYSYTPYLYNDKSNKDNNDSDDSDDGDDGDTNTGNDSEDDSEDDTNTDNNNKTNDTTNKNENKSPVKRSRDDIERDDSNNNENFKKHKNK